MGGPLGGYWLEVVGTESERGCLLVVVVGII
jgi:hypothetical protein